MLPFLQFVVTLKKAAVICRAGAHRRKAVNPAFDIRRAQMLHDQRLSLASSF
jgi:hypothetical protein